MAKHPGPTHVSMEVYQDMMRDRDYWKQVAKRWQEEYRDAERRLTEATRANMDNMQRQAQLRRVFG